MDINASGNIGVAVDRHQEFSSINISSVYYRDKELAVQFDYDTSSGILRRRIGAAK
jgi:hypothetical protein